MSEPVPGLSLRIRPRSVPPGVTPPPPPSAPDTAAPPPVDLGSQPESSIPPPPRVPAPVSCSRPPIPAPPPPIPPVAAPMAEAPMAAHPGGLPPGDASRYQLKKEPVSPLTQPPPTKAPAAAVTPSGTNPPMATTYASPLLAPRQRPEDSKLFRVGVKLFFVVGVILTVAFFWLGWKFIQDRYGIGKDAAPAGQTAPKPGPKTTSSSAPKAALDRAKGIIAEADATMKEAAANLTNGSGPASSAGNAKPLVSPLEDFTARIRVSGVAGGARPRALIDGTMCYPGQVIDPRTGIVFDRIDFPAHRLYFKDQAGNEASVRF